MRQLQERGVRRIPTVDQRFDSRTMEAVDRVERDGVDDGVVVDEVTAGYMRESKGNDRSDDVEVIRFAQVVVNRCSDAADL
jgi:molecular chaperone GrpE (heat shock protein)